MRLPAFLLALTAITIFCGTSSASVIITGNFPVPYHHFRMGDFNASGFVDSNDLEEWKSGFGYTGWSSPVRTNGDANNDQAVGGTDFLAWQRNVGKRAGLVVGGSSALTSTTVPEPSAAVLVGGALAWMLGLQRRLR